MDGGVHEEKEGTYVGAIQDYNGISLKTWNSVL